MISAPKDMWGINNFKIIVNQLGEDRACSILDIHRTTLNRYLSEKTQVPKACVLALFWESTWGRALVDSEHLFEIQLLHGKIAFLKKENARLVDALDSLEKMIDFGAANAPVLNLQKIR